MIRARVSGAVVAFLLGFALANVGVLTIARPDLWLWLAVAFVLMATGVVGILLADTRRDLSTWGLLGLELLAVVTLVPLLWVFSVATTPQGLTRRTLWPGQLSWSALVDARTNDVVTSGALTSLLVAGLASLVAVALAAPAAFGIAQRHDRHLHGWFAVALVAPTVVLAAPAAAQLLAFGWGGSRLAMVLPSLVVALPLAVWLLTRLFGTVPWTLHDALRADGASAGQRVRHFVVPYLALDVLVVAAVVFFWTAGDLALGAAMASTEEQRTLPVGLLAATMSGDVPSQVVAAAGLWWLLPALVVLFVFSRRQVALLGRRSAP